MRIALFTETFLPKIDGVVNTLCYLLDHLEKRGHQTLLFAPEGSESSYGSTEVVSLKGFRFPLYPEIRLVPPWAQVGEALRRFQPDLVHLLNPLALGVAGLRQARRLGLPTIASYHTDVPGYARLYGFKHLDRVAWSYLRWVHSQAHLNLCPSQATLRQLQARRFPGLKIWSRGVDAGRFRPGLYNEAMRARLSGGHPRLPLLLCVSRLAAEKRLDWLLPLSGALPGVRLAVVGDGPERRVLQRRFAGKPVVFTGYLRGEELAQAYASSDIFVFPSASETFGNAVLEAQASGLPVVAAAAGGPAELVQDGWNGFLFAPEDQEAMIADVRRLAGDRRLAHRLGRAGRVQAEARSWTAVLDELLRDYALLIERVRRQGEEAREVRPTVLPVWDYVEAI
jgi:glycosyltransferase involved in cell wall biosynthesis